MERVLVDIHLLAHASIATCIPMNLILARDVATIEILKASLKCRVPYAIRDS